MFSFDKKYYPKYNQLTFIEKLILKTCFYYPPKPKRIPEPNSLVDFDKYEYLLKRSFGANFCSRLKDKKVLDHGCGEGVYSITMHNHSPKLVLGLDIDSNKTYLAEKLISAHNYKNISFCNDKIQLIEKNIFDFVISHDSFEHYENPDFELKEMIRVVKPGGSIFIKFGPTWASPFGRHMSGTIRRDRPWIHLLFSEKQIMRIQSVYHNDKYLKTKYSELDGGLNKMTVEKFFTILRKNKDIEIKRKYIFPVKSNKLKFLTYIPILRNLFGGAISVELVRNK